MALHRAGDEVELCDNAQFALAIREQLAIALHRVDATEKRVARALVDVQETDQLGGRQRNARALQRVEDRGARRQQCGIEVVAAAAMSFEPRITGRCGFGSRAR